jgi:hypothetical protein
MAEQVFSVIYMKINPDQKFQCLKVRYLACSIQSVKKLDLWPSVFRAVGQRIQRFRTSYISYRVSNENIWYSVSTGTETAYPDSDLRGFCYYRQKMLGQRPKIDHGSFLPHYLHSIIYNHNIIRCYITYTSRPRADENCSPRNQQQHG